MKKRAPAGSPERSVEERFPHAAARRAADAAIDALPIDAPMHVYIDTWMTTYAKRAGHA